MTDRITQSSSLTELLFDDSHKGAIDPFVLFELWLNDARATEINDPTAAAVATADPDGLPDVRMLLMNGFDSRGPVFFTNFESDKGRQLLANPKAAILFHWKSQRRQVRMRGPIEQVTGAEADTYFATRPRISRLGAHASAQSRPLQSKAALATRVAELDAQFGEHEVPRPAHWTGFRLLPLQIEFWQDGEYRLHDRVQFRREALDAAWSRQRLNP